MRAVCLLSGGLDSTVLLTKMVCDGHEVRALTFDYGQRNWRELLAAEEVSKELNVPMQRLDMQWVGSLLKGSSQTDLAVPVPVGHYTDQSMLATVVPNRNMVMIALAAAVALAEGREAVAYAAHKGAEAIYRDCSPDFMVAMNGALRECDHRKVELYVPFMRYTKTDLVEIGHALGAPLGLTWSCYGDGELQCGRCGTCVARKEAFAKAEVTDQTVYELQGDDDAYAQ